MCGCGRCGKTLCVIWISGEVFPENPQITWNGQQEGQWKRRNGTQEAAAGAGRGRGYGTAVRPQPPCAPRACSVAAPVLMESFERAAQRGGRKHGGARIASSSWLLRVVLLHASLALSAAFAVCGGRAALHHARHLRLRGGAPLHARPRTELAPVCCKCALRPDLLRADSRCLCPLP